MRRKKLFQKGELAISTEVSSGVQPRKSTQQYTLHELPVQSAERNYSNG